MHRVRKRFGQHFLHDKQVIDQLIRAIAVQPSQHFLEIGPGKGALTIPLLQQCNSMIAVELDRDLIPVLRQQASKHGDLQIINADILNFRLNSLPGESYRIVGNLPYNISTPLMFHLLDSIDRIHDMHFMVQKEVAQRIVADVGNGHYGRLSVMLQSQCDCQYLFDVAPTCFMPPPAVDSAVIRLQPRQQAEFEISDKFLFAQIVQTAFEQRRKTVSNALKTIVSDDIFAHCGIDKRLRAENLRGCDYAALTQALSERSSDG